MANTLKKQNCYDHIKTFPVVPCGSVGYDVKGNLSGNNIKNAGGYDPIALAISSIENPEGFFLAVHTIVGGNKNSVGFGDGQNDFWIEVTETGIKADVGFSDSSEIELTFAEFAPILDAWEKAWAAAQVYRAGL